MRCVGSATSGRLGGAVVGATAERTALGRRDFAVFTGCRGEFSENAFFCELRREIVANGFLIGYNVSLRGTAFLANAVPFERFY